MEKHDREYYIEWLAEHFGPNIHSEMLTKDRGVGEGKWVKNRQDYKENNGRELKEMKRANEGMR